MAMPTQDVPGYYVWEAPGKPVVVHLRLGLIDRLSAEVMRGFGLVPKRGAEVGGVLLGSIERPPVEPGSESSGSPAIVRIDDFEVIPCEHRRGPSYQFTEEDIEPFEDACDGLHPVGYFRSHTRDGLALAPEDLELLDQFFADSANIALLIKPYATKVSTAGFFFREHGAFPDTTPLEFPFRRRDLSGEDPGPRRTLMERRARSAERTRVVAPYDTASPAEESVDAGYRADAAAEFEEDTRPVYPVPPRRSSAGGWIWAPLSLLLLLAGAGAGYWIALNGGPRSGVNAPEEFALALTVTKSGDNLSVKWDREAPAIRSAQKGLLEIEDGSSTKPVDLDAAQLRTGSLIYRNASKSVRFKLTVYPRARVSVTETMEWKE